MMLLLLYLCLVSPLLPSGAAPKSSSEDEQRMSEEVLIDSIEAKVEGVTEIPKRKVALLRFALQTDIPWEKISRVTKAEIRQAFTDGYQANREKTQKYLAALTKSEKAAIKKELESLQVELGEAEQKSRNGEGQTNAARLQRSIEKALADWQSLSSDFKQLIARLTKHAKAETSAALALKGNILSTQAVYDATLHQLEGMYKAAGNDAATLQQLAEAFSAAQSLRDGYVAKLTGYGDQFETLAKK